MNNGLLTASFVALLALGLGSAYVINDPVSASRALGLPLGGSATASERDVVAAPRASEPAPQVASEPAAAPTTIEVADAAEAPTAADPVRRPPRRAEGGVAAPQPTENVPTRIQVNRIARQVGTSTTVTGVPPSITDFPFNVVDRTFPNPRTMRVLLAVRNDSGGQWRTAYITIKSPGHPEATQFEVRDWMIGETIGLEYVFPADEMAARVSQLRIASVTGDVRESALAARLAQTRRQTITGGAPVRDRATSDLAAPGLLAVWGGLQSPVTGITVRPVAASASGRGSINVSIDEDILLDAELFVVIPETNEERQRAAQLARDFTEAAFRTEAAIQQLALELNGFQADGSPIGDRVASLPAVRQQLAVFNRHGIELATVVRRTSDNEVRRLNELLSSYAPRIRAQIESLEAQVKSVDPFFRINE